MKEIKKRLGGVEVIDVRRRDSRSRFGGWCYWGSGMRSTLKEVDICYATLPALSNTYGVKKGWREAYREKVRRWLDGPGAGEILGWLGYLLKHGITPILLCLEKDALSKAGTPLCHRVIAAEELARVLNCEVEHL